MKILVMVGFKKLHADECMCAVCDDLPSIESFEALTEHLRSVHQIDSVSIDGDGCVWLIEHAQ